ncbi:hypothetical protein BV898_00975 [Hypsibius exemplaris]|uniref:Uncharacterized protein n=1 Tax=Hypsibius exemplaris TaxID=2072580 RepID=A0A1W0XD42_HYPEX|nr:hypothetical protein BV898_00975 [Hypsibius exemplaris]
MAIEEPIPLMRGAGDAMEEEDEVDKENSDPTTTESPIKWNQAATTDVPSTTVMSESIAAANREELAERLFQKWQFEVASVKMDPEWRKTDDRLLELGRGTVEMYCGEVEDEARHVVSSNLVHLMAEMTKSKNGSKSLATEELLCSLNRTVEANFRNETFPKAVANFRRNLYEAFAPRDDFDDGFNQDLQVPLEEDDEEHPEETLNNLESLLKQLRLASARNVAIAKQRQRNARLKYILGQLDMQIRSYRNFLDFLQAESDKIETVAEIQDGLSCLARAKEQHEELRLFRQLRLRGGSEASLT